MKKVLCLLTIFMLFIPFIGNSAHAEEKVQLPSDSYQQLNSIPLYMNLDSISTTENSNILNPMINNPGGGGGGLAEIARLDYSVNTKTNVFSYKVVMTPGYKFLKFAGEASLTDLTTGFEHGSYKLSHKSGTIQLYKSKKHIFTLYVSGDTLSTEGNGMTFSVKPLTWVYNP
ncbi:MAG: hypothetical protein ACE3JK_18870 [Sporolactobacillus sp.]